MKKLLLRIFTRKLKPFYFIFSGLGLMMGLAQVLFSVQFYTGFYQSIEDKLVQPDYLPISKDVSFTNTLFNSPSVFSEKEIEELRQQPFTAQLSEFERGDFKTWAVIGGKDMGLVTDFFFEAVDDDFIDDIPDDFDWREGDQSVPIIIAEEFLNAYNHIYALNTDLPQISKGTIKNIPIKLTLKGNGKEIELKAHVVGYTERIKSVLAPQKFVRWANAQLSPSSKINRSRVIIKVKKEYIHQMDEYLEKHNMVTNILSLKSQSIISNYARTLQIIFINGFLFLVVSFVLMLTVLSLIISESKDEIVLLLQLGFKIKTITLHLAVFVLGFMTLVTAVSYTAYYFMNQALKNAVTEAKIDYDGLTVPYTWITLIAFVGLACLWSLTSIYWNVRKKF